MMATTLFSALIAPREILYSMMPDKGLRSSRSFIACMIFCLRLQAVLYETPIWRFKAKADKPVLV